MIVIVADDERFVRRGIVEHISWQSLGIDTVIEARNGSDCLKKADEFPPDILIADIRMPKMNGIDLGKEIARKYPKCKMIIISAYSDKEYLKSAISLNVVAYVEKPLVLEELEEAIRKAARSIRETRSYQESSTVYQIFEDILIQGKVTARVKELLKNMPGLHQTYSVAVVSSKWANLKYRDLNQWIKANIEEKTLTVYIYQDILPHAYLLVMQQAESEQSLEKCLAVYEKMVSEMQEKIFVSVGKITGRMEEIPLSLELAKSGQSLLFSKGYGTVVYTGSIVNQEQRYMLPERTVKQIMEFVRCGKRTEVLTLLEEIWKEIQDKSRIYTVPSIKRTLGIFLEELVGYEKDETLEELHIWEKIASSETLWEVSDIFSEIIDHLLPEDTVQDMMVKKMLRLIREEYGKQELSIPYICEKLSVSKSKACSIFKAETGKTINEYITDYRIMIAKKYLLEGLPMEEVANLTGYHDSNYFSKIFRKVTGMTPTAYRGRTKHV